MDEIARLRPDLSLTKASPEASQPYVLHDQILGRRLRLDATTAAVAGALDGRNTLAEVAALTGLNPDQLRSTLARFTRLHLLDDALSQALVAGARGILAHQTADAEDVPLVIRDDARFSCTMCGSCCGGHNVGPVMEDVLEGLDPHAAALERETASPKGLFFSMGGRPGEDVLCHSVEGSCVFLDEEGLCRIHARLGAEAKPRGCRLFPYLFVTTPKGVRVSISSECRGFVEARAGKSLREREPELRRLLSLVPSRERVPARINARGGAVLSWGAYEALEQALHAQVEASDTSEDPTAQLLAMRQLIEDHCGVGETTKVRDFEGLSHALEQLTRSVCDACAEMREQLAAAPPGLVVHTEGLMHFQQALVALRSNLERIFRPPRRPDVRALWRDVLHHTLAHATLATGARVEQSFAKLVFWWLLARSMAVERAREVKRVHVLPQDLQDALVVIGFVMRSPDVDRLLTAHGELIEALFFDGLEDLVLHASAMREPDTATHLTKF